jgi:lipopolysaccharide export system protein LptC
MQTYVGAKHLHAGQLVIISLICKCFAPTSCAAYRPSCLLPEHVLNFGYPHSPRASSGPSPRHGRLGMQSMFGPTFRRLLLIAGCAGIVLAVGCAPRKPAEHTGKLPSLFVDHKPKQNRKSKKSIKDSAAVPLGPKLEITEHGVTLRWTEKDGTQMTASAKSASFNEVTQVATVLDFSGELYENDKLTATVSAPRATVDTAKRTVIAYGGVVLKSVERQTVVNASWIRWNANTHKIVGDGGVTVKSTNGTAEAAAFTADTSLKTYTLLSSGKGLEK